MMMKNVIATSAAVLASIFAGYGLIKLLRTGAGSEVAIARVHVPIADINAGPSNAPVTLILYSDSDCPPCQKAFDGAKRLVAAKPRDVRVSLRHFPFPGHKSSRLVAHAAIAAGGQGQGLQLYEKLLSAGNDASREVIVGAATVLGMDTGRFFADLQSNATWARLEDDIEWGGRLALNEVPMFFVNGRRVAGTIPFEELSKVVEEELLRVQRHHPGASYPDDLYRVLVPPDPLLSHELARVQARLEDRMKSPVPVDTGDSPWTGAERPLVTIVEFADFRSGESARMAGTLKRIIDAYGSSVRLTYKHFPGETDQDALRTAEVAERARSQGKFWQMHDHLFLNQISQSPVDIERHAEALGLALPASGGPDVQARSRVLTDVGQARALGVTTTPTIFINGSRVEGPAPYWALRMLVEKALARAGGGANKVATEAPEAEGASRKAQN